MKITKIFLTQLIVIALTSLCFAEHRAEESRYPVHGIEEGGYSGTAFCNIIKRSDYTIAKDSIKLYDEGPYKIRINKMANVFSPYEYPHIKLVLQIRFEDKENTYADVLYIGDDNELYRCRGGK